MIGSSLFTLNYANLITGTVEIKNSVESVIIKTNKSKQMSCSLFMKSVEP